MSHTQGTLDPKSRELPDQSLLIEAQLAFLEEIHLRGGSMIATALATQVSIQDMARRACILGVTGVPQLLDYASDQRSDPNLPADIAFEDAVACLAEVAPRHMMEAEFQIMRLGCQKFDRDEIWGFDDFCAFFACAERLFAAARAHDIGPDHLPPMALDAAVRTATAILRDNPALQQRLRDPAEAMVERYFDHLSAHEIDRSEFCIFSIARGEHQSPAWIAGKLLALGLVHTGNQSLDPVLEPELRLICQRDIRDTSRSLSRRYAGECLEALRASGKKEEPCYDEARLRIAAAEHDLALLGEARPAPVKIMTILDHLDRAVTDASLASDDLRVLAFAAHSRLHRDVAFTEEDWSSSRQQA